MEKRRFVDNVVTIFVGIILMIGLFLVYSLTSNYYQDNKQAEEDFITSKETYLRLHVDRTIQLIDNYLSGVDEYYEMELNEVLDHMAIKLNGDYSGLEDLLDDYRVSYPFLKYGLLDENKNLMYIEGDYLHFDVMIDEDNAYVELLLDDGFTLFLFITSDDLERLVKTRLIPLIRDIRLENYGYIWVNEVIDYNGGDEYAIRRIHANLRDTEGLFLSTETKDYYGNLPYQIELDGIKTDGEIIFEYYFKKMDSDVISRKMSFAKLYKPFDWIIATGVHLDDLDLAIADERAERTKVFKNQLLVLGAVLFAFAGIFIWKVRLTILNSQYKSDNTKLTRELVSRAAQLEVLNASLEEEIEEREVVERKIKSINENLDQQMKGRTAQLEYLNTVLQKSVKKAEQASQAKSTFLSIMSHEMRTPLNGISGFTQMLKMSQLTEEQESLLSVITSSTNTLLELTNNILDTEKYSVGKMIFEELPFNLRDVVSESINGYKKLILNKNLSFECEISEALDVAVKGDASKIGQVISNFLSNALKFTTQGGINISIHATEKNEVLNVKVTCKDSGIGISENAKPYLFEAFTQANDTIARTFGGTGLGLTICKEIIQHYNGTIEVSSQEHVGTTMHSEFFLELTSHDQLEVISKDAVETLSIVKRKIKKILVADDGEVNRLLMEKFLTRTNLYFDVVCNGEEAVNLCKTIKYDVIFMDCQMPIMDGFEATRLIRNMKHQNAKIIAMTAYTSKEKELMCFDAGMDLFITKPINLKMVLEVLGIEINTKRKIEDYQTDQTAIGYAIKHLMYEIEYEYETCHDLILTFVHQAKTGLMEFERYYNSGWYDKISEIMHRLKGAAKSVRIKHLGQMFDDIENLLNEKSYEQAYKVFKKIKSDDIFK